LQRYKLYTSHTTVCSNLITRITAFSRLVKTLFSHVLFVLQGRHFLKSQFQHIVSSKCHSITLEKTSGRVALLFRSDRLSTRAVLYFQCGQQQNIMLGIFTVNEEQNCVCCDIWTSGFQGSRSYPRIIPRQMAKGHCV